MVVAPSSPETTCIYCNRTFPINEFSLEHIFPSALGGKACGDLFKTRTVCSRCNNTTVLHVDGAFIKSWFTTNGAAASAFTYLDPISGGLVPYTYIGNIPALSDAEYLYEFWVGPSGENVYSRSPRDDKFFGYAGGNPITTKKVGRDVIIFGTTTEAYWLKVGLLSFSDFFYNDRRYSGNFQLSQDSSSNNLFIVPDLAGNEFIEKVKQYRSVAESNNTSHGCAFSVDIGFADRFLVKLALGLGSSLFGDDFVISPYAKHLRDALWAKSTDERHDIPLRGVGYWDINDNFDRLMAWPGGHTIMLQRFRDDVALVLYVYGKKSGIVVITDEFSKFTCELESSLNDGIVYILVPSRRICTKPIPMQDFVSHQVGNSKNAELASIEALRVELKDLPPR